MDWKRRWRSRGGIWSGLLFLALFAIPPGAGAEEEPAGAYGDERAEIVLTYTREEMPRENAAADISVITREDMEKIRVTNAAEALQYVPGVFMEFAGGLGSLSFASIQGSNPWQVAVYQDGVPLNFLSSQLAPLSNLSLAAIERIEVYKGAASSSWGSALGGVINIITREPDTQRPFGGEATASYGDFNTYLAQGTVSGTVDGYGYLLSYSHQRSDGFMEYSGFREDAGYFKFNAPLGSRSRISFVYSDNENRIGDPVPRFPEFWDDIYFRTTYQRLMVESALSDGLDLSVEGRHKVMKEAIDDVFDGGIRARYNQARDEGWGVSSRLKWSSSEKNQMLLGLDTDWGEYDFIPNPQKYFFRNLAVYGNDTYNIGKFSITGGLRLDDNYDFGSEVSPSLGAVYHIQDNRYLVRAQVARGFNAPPASWLHDPTYGNEDLKPEIGMNYQLGGEAHIFKFLHLNATLFRSDVENLIRRPPPDYRFTNLAEAVRQGVEGTASVALENGLAFSFSGSFIDVRDADTGDVIPDVPRVLYSASFSYVYNKWLTNSLIGRYVDNNSSWPETNDKVFVFDYMIKARLPLPCMSMVPTFFAAVHNITNVDYLYTLDFPQPGRWAEAGVKLEF